MTDAERNTIVSNTAHTTSDGLSHVEVVNNKAHREIVTGNPHNVTKSEVGLGNADNTSDADKPISNAAQAALDTKPESTDNIDFFNDVNYPVPPVNGELVKRVGGEWQNSNIDKNDVGLDQVDNTSDANKPVSSAQQAALDLKANQSDLDDTNTDLTIHVADLNNPHQVTKAQVGLGDVNNTSDLDKPVSTATQDAIDIVSGDVTNVENNLNIHIADTANPHQTTVQKVVDEGNQVNGTVLFDGSNSGTVYLDGSGSATGYVTASVDFGVTVFGTDNGTDLNRPVTVGGDTVLIANDNLLTQFNGAETGDFLRIIAPLNINGRDFYTVNPVALETTLYREEFTSTSDVILSTTYANIVQGTLVNTYTDGNSQALYVFEVRNDDNQDRNLEFSITSDDGTPTEIFSRILPKNASTFVTGSDSVTGGDIAAGSTVEIQARVIEATGGVTVRGTQTTTTLTLEQNTSTANAIQGSSVEATGTTLKLNILNKVTANDTYLLPELSTITEPEDKIQLVIYNDSDNIATINTIGSDVVNLPQDSGLNTFKVYPYESYRLYASSQSGNTWGVVGSNKRPYRVSDQVLVAQSFNNQQPVATDTPIVVEFGAAQGTISDPVMIDALGRIDFNEEGIYLINIVAEFGRTGGAGVSELRFRMSVNGVGMEPVISAMIDNANTRVPLIITVPTINAVAGMYLEFELLRDSTGNNSGGLFSTNTTLAGWADSPSARVIINRMT